MKKIKRTLAIVLALSLVLPIFSLTVAGTSTGSIDATNGAFTTLSEYKESVAIENIIFC